MTQKLMFLFLLLMVSVGYSQKVAVIGINHVSTAPFTDGFTFVVTQDLVNGEIIYFTENEYSDAANAFVDNTEATVAFTAGSAIVKGTVVYVNETSIDTFTVTCTGGGSCGAAVKTPTSSNFALATDGETFYAYSDSDNNPVNGVTTIHSVMFTGDTQPAPVNGGTIPTNQNPSFDYPTAIVIDGFPAVLPGRVEFTPTVPARNNVSKVVLENPTNYVHAQAHQALSTIFFTNLTLVDPNPIVTVTASPTSVLENSGTGMVYTFSLSANAVSNLTINFTVGGLATFSSDYSQTGAATFNATTGTVTILSGSNTASFTLTPVGDTTLEPNETAIITITAGTGYVAGSPGAATTTINNDDTSNLDPLIAITGISHADPDGFSFVAAQDIPANTVVYFTDNSFDNSSLLFGTGDAVLRWTSPGSSAITKGNVVVITESSPDVFTLTCSNGTCGSITLISGNFAIATTGETMYAYQDSDTNPSNGVTNIYGVIFTGTSSISGGSIPAIEDPSTIFLKSIVVDGFPATAPARTEYDPTKRAVLVTDVDFENIANWIHAQTPPALSTVPFTNISLVPPLALTSLTQTNISCNAGNNGAASVNPATGGTAPYTYNWTPGNPTGDGTTSVTGLIAGTWTCTVTDGVGATATRTFNITQPSALVASAASQTNISCFGGSNGAASVTVSGGTTAYTYNWTPGNPTGDGTASVTGLIAGTWTCTVTDANSCTTTRTFNITQPSALVASVASQTNISCNGGTNGAASVTVSGGTTAYSYNWTPGNPTGDGTASVTGLVAGTWTCTVTDANLCTTTQTFNITQPSALVASVASQTNISCNGGSNGAASVTVSGGTTAYSYNWTPGNPTGDGTASVTGLIAGTWTCTVTDANSCTATQTFNITQPTAITASISSTPSGCTNNTGTATVSAVSGGTPGYTYLWQPSGATVATLTNLAAGTYSCTITDANACNIIRVTTVAGSSGPTLTSASQTNISCNGGTNGAASVNAATGGTGPYTYNWTPGNPTGDGTVSVTGLSAGTWTCTVTDANSCTATQTFNITQPTALVASAASQTNISCNGGSNGAASVTVSGGTTAYSYNWTPGNPTGDGTASVTGLIAGTWTCTVTDANLCTTTQTFNITQPLALVATALSQTNISCNAGSNGAASVTVSGGTTTYSYNWTPGNPTGDGTASVTGLIAGTWTCTVTDANSCTTTQTFNITQPSALVASAASQTNISCNGESNGAASVSVSGGTTAYSYNWTPGNPTGDGTVSVTGLSAGTWTCTVTDANSCTTTQTFNITQPSALVASAASQTNISCNGGSNGAASVTVSGGTTAYSYNWTPGNPTGDGTASVTGLTAGTWTCTVTDANSCTTTQTFNITQPAVLVASSSPGTITCFGGTTTINITATGGNTPYTGTGIFTVGAGAYSFLVTDATGCTTTISGAISQPALLTTSTTITSATPYIWSVSGLTYPTSGVYVFNTVNGSGCTVVNTLNLTIVNSGPTVNTFVIGTSCGATISGLNVTIIAAFGGSSYVFRVTNLATSISQSVTRPVNSFALSNMPGILLGTAYQIEVSINGGPFGPPCIVNTPSPTSTIGTQCGTTLTAMSQWVYATYYPTVTGYRFRVTNTSNSTVQIFDSGLNRFSFNQLANRSFGTIYTVEVALRNTNGTYLPFSLGCSITTPAFPASEIVLSQCDYTALSNTQSIGAVLVSGATLYRFLIYNTTLGYSFSIDRAPANFNLNMFPGLLAGTTYSVQVAVKIGGVFGPYGKICNLTTPAGTRVNVDSVSNLFNVVSYPNPFAENFMLHVKTSSESTLQVRVYDMLGKQIDNRNVDVSEIENLQIGSNYPSGVYNVIVSQESNTQTLRVIKR